MTPYSVTLLWAWAPATNRHDKVMQIACFFIDGSKTIGPACRRCGPAFFMTLLLLIARYGRVYPGPLIRALPCAQSIVLTDGVTRRVQRAARRTGGHSHSRGNAQCPRACLAARVRHRAELRSACPAAMLHPGRA